VPALQWLVDATGEEIMTKMLKYLFRTVDRSNEEIRNFYGQHLQHRHRVDKVQKTHIIIMATMKTGTICNIPDSNDDWRVIGIRFDGLELLHFIFDAGSVVLN